MRADLIESQQILFPAAGETFSSLQAPKKRGRGPKFASPASRIRRYMNKSKFGDDAFLRKISGDV